MGLVGVGGKNTVADAVRIEWVSGGGTPTEVNPAVGKYAMINSFEGNTATLDRSMMESADEVTAYVVHQDGVPASAAMAVMSVRTTLRE